MEAVCYVHLLFTVILFFCFFFVFFSLQCTRTCQGGVQYRKVTCVGGTTCDLELEPPAQKPCGGDPCPKTVTENSAGTEETRTTLSPPEESKTTLLAGSSQGDSLVLNNPDDSISLGSETEKESTNVVLGDTSIGLGKSDENQVIIPSGSNNDADLGSAKTIGSKQETPPAPEHKHRHHHNKHHQEHHHNRNQDTVVVGGNVSSAENPPVAPESKDAEVASTSTEKDAGEASDVEENADVAEEQTGAEAEGDFEWYAGDWRKVMIIKMESVVFYF